MRQTEWKVPQFSFVWLPITFYIMAPFLCHEIRLVRELTRNRFGFSTVA